MISLVLYDDKLYINQDQYNTFMLTYYYYGKLQ